MVPLAACRGDIWVALSSLKPETSLPSYLRNRASVSSWPIGKDRQERLPRKPSSRDVLVKTLAVVLRLRSGTVAKALLQHAARHVPASAHVSSPVDLS